MFFEKWPKWDITNVERNKVMKNEISLGILQRAIQGNLLVGAQHSVIEGIKLVKDLCRCISISKGCVKIRWKISDPRIL